MAILSKSEIQRRLKLEIKQKESLVITPRPRSEAFDSDSVDLRLGCHFLMPQMPPDPSWGSAQVGGYSHTRVHVPLGSYFVVPSHETVLGVTLEFIKLPSDLSGQILTKSSVARCFMVIETAPWIHPLYRGCLTLEIANVSNTPLTIFPGLPIAQLVLIRNDNAAEFGMPDGSYVGPVYPEEPPKRDLCDQMHAAGIAQYRDPAHGKWKPSASGNGN
ncbi:MAG: dCTP deaminase domain-containing protein [Terracidiphilus sp.]